MTPLCIALLAFLVPRAAQDLAGDWTGRMEPENLSAEITMHFERAGEGWSASMQMTAGPQRLTLEVKDVCWSADSLSFAARIEGAQVRFEGHFDDGLLVGTLRAIEDGRTLVEGPWGLAREKDLPHLLEWLDTLAVPIDEATQRDVVERALALLRTSYVSAEGAAKAEQEVREGFDRGAFRECKSAARFAELLGRELSEATGDRHLRVRYERTSVIQPSEGEETQAEREAARADGEAINFGFRRIEILEGNVGYLDLRRFVRADLAGDTLEAAMGFLAHTDALILDLRECGGGDPVMVALFSSWFFDGRTRLFTSFYRRHDDATTQVWTAPWLPGARYVQKPLYLLTAQRTFSAPEGFAYELQAAGRATLVGEATGGGAHPGQHFPLGDHYSMFVPLSRSIRRHDRRRLGNHRRGPGHRMRRDGGSPDRARRSLEAPRAHAGT